MELILIPRLPLQSPLQVLIFPTVLLLLIYFRSHKKQNHTVRNRQIEDFYILQHKSHLQILRML